MLQLLGVMCYRLGCFILSTCSNFKMLEVVSHRMFDTDSESDLIFRYDVISRVSRGPKVLGHGAIGALPKIIQFNDIS